MLTLGRHMSRCGQPSTPQRHGEGLEQCQDPGSTQRECPGTCQESGALGSSPGSTIASAGTTAHLRNHLRNSFLFLPCSPHTCPAHSTSALFTPHLPCTPYTCLAHPTPALHTPHLPCSPHTCPAGPTSKMTGTCCFL